MSFIQSAFLHLLLVPFVKGKGVPVLYKCSSTLCSFLHTRLNMSVTDDPTLNVSSVWFYVLCSRTHPTRGAPGRFSIYVLVQFFCASLMMSMPFLSLMTSTFQISPILVAGRITLVNIPAPISWLLPDSWLIRI